jgi:hypothetical protein
MRASDMTFRASKRVAGGLPAIPFHEAALTYSRHKQAREAQATRQQQFILSRLQDIQGIATFEVHDIRKREGRCTCASDTPLRAGFMTVK